MSISEVMGLHLDHDVSDQQLIELLSHLAAGRTLCCHSEEQYRRLQGYISQHDYIGVQVQLLDDANNVINQCGSSVQCFEDGLTARQITVLKALERVLSHCRKEGVQLIGYSDELVAVPAGCDRNTVVSSTALPIETFNTYLSIEMFGDES